MPTGTTTYYNDVGVTVNPIRYKGYYYDTESGFYYLQSRYYDPVVGRFISADTPDYLGSSGTVLSFNLFAYCENDPLLNQDPTGHSTLVVYSSYQLAISISTLLAKFLPAIASLSRAAFVVMAALVIRFIALYLIGKTMLKEVEKAQKNNLNEVKGTYSVYVLIADAVHGGGVFYVGRKKNISKRYSAHKRDLEKKKVGGDFMIQPVYVNLNWLESRVYEQALMNAFEPEILINKIRGLARNKISPIHFVESVLSRIGDIAEDEWLNYIGS